MRTLMNRINSKLLIRTFLILLLCRIDIVFANEPIATIGRPHPEKHAFIDNRTLLRVVPTHIEVVRANTGEVIDEFGNLDFSYRGNVAISPNASHISVQNYSSISKKRTIKILDSNLREQIAEWEIEGYIDTQAISPTQSMLATSIDNEIYLWNLQTGEKIGTMVGERRPPDTCYYVDGRRRTCLGPVRDFASVFTPDGRYLIVASQRPDIELWNVETLELEGHFEGHAGNWVSGVTISPDGAYLASYDREQPTVYLWNMNTRELMWQTQTDRRRIADLKFSPNSQNLYVARSDVVESWNVKSGELIDTLNTEFRWLQAITISPDSKKALLMYMDGEILWDIENKQVLNEWTDFITYWYQNEIELSPDGKTVLAMSPLTIKSFDVSSQNMRMLVSTQDNRLNTIAISHDNQKFAVGREPVVEIRNIQTGEIETQFPHHILLPEKICFSPSGRWLAVKDHWSHVDILDIDSPEKIQRLKSPVGLGSPNGNYRVGFSDNEEYFVTSGSTKISNNNYKYWIVLWKRVEDTFAFKYAWLGGFASDPIFMTTEDGSTLLAGNGREGIHIWKLLEDKPLLLSTFDAEYPLQFSKDGRYLFAYSEDKFQIWDWKRSKLINQKSFPWFISMSDDSSLLLTHDIHGQYLIWDLTHMQSFLPYSVEPNGKQFVTLGQIKRNQLLQNFPNPFNPETWIPFKLADESNVTIDIHSSTGELICSLSPGTMKAGDYSTQTQAVHWDGKNNDGEAVSSGIYFYTINAGGFSATRKMLIQK